MDTKLYVGNLSYSVTEDELRELFAQAGNIRDAAKERRGQRDEQHAR